MCLRVRACAHIHTCMLVCVVCLLVSERVCAGMCAHACVCVSARAHKASLCKTSYVLPCSFNDNCSLFSPSLPIFSTYIDIFKSDRICKFIYSAHKTTIVSVTTIYSHYQELILSHVLAKRDGK